MKDKNLKRIAVIASIVIVSVACLFAIWSVYRSSAWGKSFSDSYYAVFMDNGQVYFGKIISQSGGFLALEKVFYLQANEQKNQTVGAGEIQFNLIKLGQELHGPKDEMMINMEHVVFYEEMRDDSKVVESINNQQD